MRMHCAEVLLYAFENHTLLHFYFTLFFCMILNAGPDFGFIYKSLKMKAEQNKLFYIGIVQICLSSIIAKNINAYQSFLIL